MWYIAIHVSLHGCWNNFFFLLLCFHFFSTCPFFAPSLYVILTLYFHIHVRTSIRLYERHRKKINIYFIPDECEKTQIEKNKKILWKKLQFFSILSFFLLISLILLLTYVCLYAWAMSRWNINLAFLDFKPLLFTSIFYCFVCLNMLEMYVCSYIWGPVSQ